MDLISEWEFPEVEDLRYHTILRAMSKKELLHICKGLKIQNLSNLKKGEIQSILYSDIKMYLATTLSYMNDELLRVLNKILLEDTSNIATSHPSERILNHFFSLGMIYPITHKDKQCYAIPKEIKSAIIKLLDPQMMKIFDRNNRVIQFAHQCCERYGLIDYQKFNYLYHLRYPEDEIYHEVHEIIDLEAQCRGQFICMYNAFYHPLLKDKINLFLEHRKGVKEIDYYPLLEVELKNGCLDLQDQTIQQKLKKTVKKLSQDEQNKIFKWIFNRLNQGISLEELNFQFKSEFQYLPDKQTSRLMLTINKYSNRLRLWTTKGHRKIDI